MNDRVSVTDLVSDLGAEHEALDAILRTLPDADWAAATPSPGWNVADQIGHLGYFDRTATLAIVDEDAFAAHLVEALGEIRSNDLDDLTLREPRVMTPGALHTWWREGAAALVGSAAQLDDDTRLPWYGPPMSARSFVTARLMETWAHGHDIADTVGHEVEPSSRLRHIAQLGVITRGWSYGVRGLSPPDVAVRVELGAPDGGEWVWGDRDAAEVVRGTALDFCRVVTQRRHVDDTNLATVGDAASEWMHVAQAFAGAPTQGPSPRSNR